VATDLREFTMIRALQRKSSALARRAVPAMAGLAIVPGAIMLTGSAASADGPACHYDSQHNGCLWITETWPGSGEYEVHIGIDVYMSQAQAQAIIDRGGALSVKVMGDDPSYDDLLFTIDPFSVGAAPHGLSAEFRTSRVPGEWLDEDWEGRDEVYARITLSDPGRSSRTFTTGQLTGYF
jgi:hypothetical protein